MRNTEANSFAKLHNMKKVVDAVGQLETAQIEAHVVEELRKRFADLLAKWPRPA